MQSSHWQINWIIDDHQIRLTKEFYKLNENCKEVADRLERNIKGNGIDFSKEFMWKVLINCLFTTQQKSGPNSRVTKFIKQVPFPLSLEACIDNLEVLESFSGDLLTQYGGIRRANSIANQLQINIKRLISNNWSLLATLEAGHKDHHKEQAWEREMAIMVQDELTGIGPKQSRNLLQMLGVTCYEIPIDSRIINWLNSHNFPIHLTSTALSDRNIYHFLLEGIQQLCKEASIYPCLLDAAIFTSYD